MSKERADLGFTDALENFTPEDWVPKKKIILLNQILNGQKKR